MTDELQPLRSRIDEADAALITALAERMGLVKKIGELKRAQGIPARNDARWKEVVAHATSEAEKRGLSPALIEEIFEAIHRAALEIEENKDV